MGYSVNEQNDAIDAVLYAYEAMDQLMDEFIEAGLVAKDFNLIAPNMIRSDKSTCFITEDNKEQNVFFDGGEHLIPSSMYTAVGRVPLFKAQKISITDEISDAFAQHAWRFMGLKRYDHQVAHFLGGPRGDYWIRHTKEGYFKNRVDSKELLNDIEERALMKWFH